MRLISALFLLAFSLTSCALAPLVVPIAAVEGLSLVTTEKAVEDHLFSAYSGKDCSAVRVNKGDTYCKEDEPNPTPAVHCYRTLGDITCYNQPDPQQGEGGGVASPQSTLRIPK